MDRHGGVEKTIARKRAAMNDELGGRTVVILPGCADGLRGPAKTLAITGEARTIADAIVGRLDRIDIFEANGQLVFLAQGGLHNVNAEVLREIIRTNFVSKCIVNAGTGLSKEYRPVEVGELVVRTLLTAPPRDGGLIGRVPMAAMEAPRQAVEEAAVVHSNPIEHAAGQRALAKHSGGASGERTQQEIARGRQRLAELQDRPPQP
jgi:hypothetical protein